jgi:hypothetical protein
MAKSGSVFAARTGSRFKAQNQSKAIRADP